MNWGERMRRREREEANRVAERELLLREVLVPFATTAARERWPAAAVTLTLASLGYPTPTGEGATLLWLLRVCESEGKRPVIELRLPLEVEPSSVIDQVEAAVWSA